MMILGQTSQEQGYNLRVTAHLVDKPFTNIRYACVMFVRVSYIQYVEQIVLHHHIVIITIDK